MGSLPALPRRSLVQRLTGRTSIAPSLRLTVFDSPHFCSSRNACDPLLEFRTQHIFIVFAILLPVARQTSAVTLQECQHALGCLHLGLGGPGYGRHGTHHRVITVHATQQTIETTATCHLTSYVMGQRWTHPGNVIANILLRGTLSFFEGRTASLTPQDNHTNDTTSMRKPANSGCAHSCRCVAPHGPSPTPLLPLCIKNDISFTTRRSVHFNKTCHPQHQRQVVCTSMVGGSEHGPMCIQSADFSPRTSSSIVVYRGVRPCVLLVCCMTKSPPCFNGADTT